MGREGDGVGYATAGETSGLGSCSPKLLRQSVSLIAVRFLAVALSHVIYCLI